MLYDDVGSTLTSYGVLFFELNTEYYLIVVINCEAYDYLHEYLGRIPRERSSLEREALVIHRPRSISPIFTLASPPTSL